MPARALAELNRLLADEEEPVQMTLNANQDAGPLPAEERRAGRAAHPGHLPQLQPAHPAERHQQGGGRRAPTSCGRRASPRSSPATAAASCASVLRRARS